MCQWQLGSNFSRTFQWLQSQLKTGLQPHDHLRARVTELSSFWLPDPPQLPKVTAESGRNMVPSSRQRLQWVSPNTFSLFSPPIQDLYLFKKLARNHSSFKPKRARKKFTGLRFEIFVHILAVIFSDLSNFLLTVVSLDTYREKQNLPNKILELNKILKVFSIVFAK